jgi:hypothetical protein
VPRVPLVPQPAITGAPRPWVRAASTQISTTRTSSSWLSVAPSPVVPQGTSASVPLSSCHSASARSARSSTAPSLNGVTRATIDPASFSMGGSGCERLEA